jgi:hypothetical protein
MTSLTLPPRQETAEGRPRRVGVEIEFAGVDAQAAARLVEAVFGGRAELTSKHQGVVRETRFGEFEIELDSSHAHPKGAEEVGELRARLSAELRETVGDVVSAWMPFEIVGPPVPITDLPAFDELVARLREQRAEGTRANPLYGFGVQLNPEVAATDVAYLLAHLQAYLVLSPWLRREIEVDATRRLLPFADPFPEAYAQKVLAKSYTPSLDQLIDDYLEANPTRNRELDLLPLFAHLDEPRVRSRVDDPKIKPRPTFHYRLPNSGVDDPAWVGIVGEWNRWVEVERLADDPPRLRETADAFLASQHGPVARWVEQVRGWLGG